MPSTQTPLTPDPATLDRLDGRLSVVKKQKRRIRELLELGTSSHPLCKEWATRAAFIEWQIADLEGQVLHGEFDRGGTYTQLCNLLERLYDRLGIQEQGEQEPAEKLDAYLEAKSK